MKPITAHRYAILVNKMLVGLRNEFKRDPSVVLKEAIDMARPQVKLLRVKRGAKVNIFPVSVSEKESVRLAIKWIIDASAKRNEHNFHERLQSEIRAIVKEAETAVVQRRNELHKLALANRSNVKLFDMKRRF